MKFFWTIVFAALAVSEASSPGQQSGPPDPSKIRARPLGPDGKPLPVEGGSSSNQSAREDLLAYADLLYSQKQYALAARQYTLFLQEHPQSPNLQAGWFRLGECYLQVNQTADSETTFKYVVDTYKTGPFVGSSAYRLAVIRYNAKDFQEARDYFELATQHIQSPEAKLQASFYRARSLQFLDDADEAIKAYDEVLNAAPPVDPEKAKNWKNPFREQCLLETARLQYDLGEAEEAFRKFEELANSATNSEYRLEALARAGLLAAEVGEAEKSSQYLDQAMKIEGENPWKSLARIGLLFNHFANEEYDEVLSIYTQGVFDAPSDTRPKLLLIVGHSYRLTDKLDAAIETYEIVEQNFRTRREGAEAGYRKLQCLHQQKDGGLPVYVDQFVGRQREIDRQQSFIDLALLMKAEWFFGLAQKTASSEQAIQYYEEAAGAYASVREDKVPEKYHEPRLYKLGWSEIESGDNLNGIRSLSNFVRRFPENKLIPSALAKRATAHQSSDDFKAALGDYREIATKYPDAAEAEFALQQIALIHGNLREVPEMIVAYRELLEKYPETPGRAEAHYWIGVGHFDQEEYESAIEPLNQARKLDENAYGAKASLRIILAHYQMESLDALADEADAYLDGGKAAAEPPSGSKTGPNAENGNAGVDKPAVARPGNAEKRPSIPPQVLSYLGRRLFDRQEFDRAEKFLTAASTPDSPSKTPPEIWELLGQSRLNLRKFSEAITPWENFLAMTQIPSEQGKAWLAKGQALFELKELEQSRESARECLKKVKQGRTNAKGRLLLGDIAAAEGDMAGAAREYLVVSQIFSDKEITPIALKKAADAYRQAGDDQKAADLENQLRTSFPDFKGTTASAGAGQ